MLRAAWRGMPIAAVLSLVLATGALGYVFTSQANAAAEHVHRRDRQDQQEVLAGLARQYLLLSAKDAHDYANSLTWSLRPNDPRDAAKLQTFVSRTTLLNYGAAVMSVSGDVLDAVATDAAGLPPVSDAGYQPLKSALLAGQPGVSALMPIKDGHVVAIGVPIGTGAQVRAVFVGYFRAETSALQTYLAQLHYGRTGAGLMVDGAGQVVASSDAHLIGSSVMRGPVAPALHSPKPAWVRFAADQQRMVMSIHPVVVGGWYAATQQSEPEFYGAIRAGNLRVKRALLALVALVAALLTAGGFMRRASLRRFHDQLSHQAFHDAVTGLPNRLAFVQRLTAAVAEDRRGRHRAAVLYLDLDRFKVANDSLGHDIGDLLLVSVARRLETVVRGSDFLARMGGDEFTVLLEPVDDPRPAIEAAERILGALQDPFEIGDRLLHVGASIGICVSTGHETAQDMLRQADLAMYRAKARGRATYQVFEPDLAASAQLRLWAEAELRAAIHDGGFVLHYQPVVDLADAHIVGLEALVRWQHPHRGLLPPGDFIPLAEDTDLIVPLGAWVLGEATRQAAEWRTATSADLTISVNVSGRQLARGTEFVNDVAAALDASGLPAAALVLEVTETVIIEGGTELVETVAALRGLGVNFAIDDFGTGYSSLSHLKRFTVANLKLDRSFVADVVDNKADRSIARSVVQLAKDLDLRVTAEGIETPEQLDTLRKMGCHDGQGFFLSAPKPAADIRPLLEGTMVMPRRRPRRRATIAAVA